MPRADSQNNYLIYRLTSPSGKLYIGITKKGIKRRWREHVNKARKGGRSRIARAIQAYGAGTFSIDILERNLAEDEARRRERDLISFYGSNRPEIGYNISSGGDGDTLAAAVAAAEMKADPSRRAKWIEKMRRGQADPDYKARHSAMLKARWADPEFREKMRALRASPEYRAKLKARMADPSVIAKKSAATRTQMSDPAARAAIGIKNSARYSTEEGRARCAERARKANANPATKQKQVQAALRLGTDPLIKAERSRRRREILAADPGIAKRISEGRRAGILARRQCQ